MKAMTFADPSRDGNLILVTHDANIRAVTGVAPAPGEMIVLAPRPDGAFTVAGRLAPPAP
jgi:hypothetical protein